MNWVDLPASFAVAPDGTAYLVLADPDGADVWFAMHFDRAGRPRLLGVFYERASGVAACDEDYRPPVFAGDA